MESNKIKRSTTESNDHELTDELLTEVSGGTACEDMNDMIEGMILIGAITES